MQDLKIKTITLKEVIKEAKRIYPELNIQTALKYYVTIQMSIGVYSSDYQKKLDTLPRYNLAMLILDAFEPDYDFQSEKKFFLN